MFVKYLLAFSLCYLQVTYAYDEDVKFDYDSCMEDVDTTVSTYAEIYQFFLIERYRWIVNAKDTLAPKLLKLEETDAKCAEENFILEIFLACKGIFLEDNKFLPNFDESTTDEEGCKWIAETAPEFVAGVEHNKEVIKVCDVEETYDNIIANGFCNKLK